MILLKKAVVIKLKAYKLFVVLFLIIGVIFIFGACKRGEPSDSDAIYSESLSDADLSGTNQGGDTTAQTEPLSVADAVEQTDGQTAKNANSNAETAQQANASTLTGVEKYTDVYNSVEQIVFYPKSLKNSAKTYPVIVWANGTMCTYDLYEELLKKIADGGYIVVANAETMAADGKAQIASIDFIISESSNSASVLYQKINVEKIAAAGHSQGGRSAVNAAASDARIDCVLSVAGSNYTEEAERLRAPAFFMTGTRDMVVLSDSWVKPAYAACKGPAVYASLKDGIHTSCSAKPSTYAYYAVKWFDAWLKNDSASKDIFRSGGALSDDRAWTDFACKGF